MSEEAPNKSEDIAQSPVDPNTVKENASESKSAETGGPKGPEPTRYGDWEKKGRCIDF